MHPGFVRTSLDPSTHALDEAVVPNKAAGKLWEVLMNKRIEETGRFWHREAQCSRLTVFWRSIMKSLSESHG